MVRQNIVLHRQITVKHGSV